MMFPIVEKYLAGGTTQKHFCQQHDLPKQTFCYWLKKYRTQKNHDQPRGTDLQQATAARTGPNPFIPVHVVKAGVVPGCEIVYPTGVCLRFAGPVKADLLLQLIGGGA